MSQLIDAPVFDFTEKRIEAETSVTQVTQWFNAQPYIQRAILVQNDQSYFYHGDIYLQFHQRRYSGFLEMKVETRTTYQTPNLAIERWSNTQRQTTGGPWSSRGKYYAHIYADNVLVIMGRKRLINWIEMDMNRWRTFSANNPGYVTSGILIPRKALIQAFGKQIGVYEVAS